MPASLLASILTFSVIGAYKFFTVTSFEQCGKLIHYMIFGTIVTSAAFFFIYEIVMELTNEEAEDNYKDAKPTEWILRVVAHVILINLWFTLEPNYGPLPVFLGLFALYSCFILWDINTWQCQKDHRLAIFDIIGCVCAGVSGFALAAFEKNHKQLTSESLEVVALLMLLTTIHIVVNVIAIYSAIKHKDKFAGIFHRLR